MAPWRKIIIENAYLITDELAFEKNCSISFDLVYKVKPVHDEYFR